MLYDMQRPIITDCLWLEVMVAKHLPILQKQHQPLPIVPDDLSVSRVCGRFTIPRNPGVRVALYREYNGTYRRVAGTDLNEER